MKPSWWKTAPKWLRDDLGGEGYELPGTEPAMPVMPPMFSPGFKRVHRDPDRIERDQIIRRW